MQLQFLLFTKRLWKAATWIAPGDAQTLPAGVHCRYSMCRYTLHCKFFKILIKGATHPGSAHGKNRTQKFLSETRQSGIYLLFQKLHYIFTIRSYSLTKVVQLRPCFTAEDNCFKHSISQRSSKHHGCLKIFDCGAALSMYENAAWPFGNFGAIFGYVICICETIKKRKFCYKKSERRQAQTNKQHWF